MQEDHERQNARTAARAHLELLNPQCCPVLDQSQVSQQPGTSQGSRAGPAACKPTFDNTEYVHPDELEGLSYNLPPALQQDNIKTEYHPRSGIPMKTDHFADFCCHTAAPSLVRENTTPWEPFTSRIDFDFTELVLKANPTKLQTNELISLIRRSALKRFSVTDYDGICKLWDTASSRHAKFKKEVISVPHRDQEHDFDVWYRPLWDWACDLLKDPRLGPHFVFDAQWLYKFDGRDFLMPSGIVKYSSLPKDEGKPFAFIIYADKAKLSSFGRQKAYPVIVEEDRQYSGTQSFVNFKNVVWHKSFKCLLKSLAPLSKTGFWVKCWDGIERLFYLLILILSADYEEQEARNFVRQEDKEKVLMSRGLQDVDNTFSNVAHTDVHFAVSFDRLHFQERVKSIGRQTQSQIDVHFDSMPHWRNINHFNHLIVLAAHDVIDRATHALPYLLLQWICEYVNIDIAKDDSGKNWAYPKRHAHAHLFDDIEAKGATRNTNTKPNEKCHGPIRWIFLRRTNFKNIAEQVLRLDHRFLIAHSIHLDIEDYDDLITSQNDPLHLDSKDDECPNNDSDATLHIKLGAAQKEQTFATLEQLHANDNAFNRFHIKLANFLSDSLLAHRIPLPGGK
ncbi:hypothetical protein DFJ58DRAFT_844771 [Suillus subalutaceus]|uniref:uncharacterized protein n=1 Tax=Suillus subalutaceus TaxID=48586 RepID=UPI001B872A5F|nr:uncharacterized protein DFJ58DRAFT_844771 [Suillus subalutaceus]KAG1842161.1 hypothetical protein DFJ58DRAFT_844771 [Suillus subalutaceus]